MKLQKLVDLLLNLVVVFETPRIKGVTPLRATAAKQLVISARKISALIPIAYIAIPSCRGSIAQISFNSLARFSHRLHARARRPCASQIPATGLDTRKLLLPLKLKCVAPV